MMFECSPDDPLLLVYACSGCFNVAQLANDLALCLSRTRLVEMPYIAGIGGDVPSLVRRTRSGRPILALDGRPLHHVKGCLTRHKVVPTLHLTLSEYGLKKRYGEDCKVQDAECLFVELERLLTPSGKYRCERRYGRGQRLSLACHPPFGLSRAYRGASAV